MKINTISDLKRFITSLERYDENTPLSTSIDGKQEYFSITPINFGHTFGQKQPDRITLNISKATNGGQV